MFFVSYLMVVFQRQGKVKEAFCWLPAGFAITDIMEPEGEVPNPSSLPGQVHFVCSKLLVTGQWYHLTVTVAKEAKRNCIVSAYIDGHMLGSAKVKALCTGVMPDICLLLLLIFIWPLTYYGFLVTTWDIQSIKNCMYSRCHSVLCVTGVRNPYKVECICGAFQKGIISLYLCLS